MFLDALLVLFSVCVACQSRGVIECKKHTKEIKELENTVLFCSAVAACECGGSFWIDCPNCESGSETERVSKRRNEIAQWTKQNAVANHLKKPVKEVETERFDIILDVGPMKEGLKYVDPHVFIHRAAKDLESIAKKIEEQYKIGPKDYSSKMRLWVWESPDDHRSVMSKFLFSNSTGDYKMLGKDPVFSVQTQKGHFDDVPKLRALLAHNAPHMLLSNLFECTWVGDIGGGWFDEGAGHWYEYELFGRTVNYCIEEASIPPAYKNGQWRAAVRARVDSEEGRFLPFIIRKSSGNLTAAENAICWSLYDWIVDQYPASLNALLQGLKKKKAPEELFKEIFGMSVIGTESAWRAWVKKTYPREGDIPLKK